MGIDSNETNLTVYDGASREVRGIDTSPVAKVSRDHERRVRRGTKGKQNPKAKKKVAAKHGRRRREKVAELWHHIALMLIAQAIAAGAALVLEDLKGIKGRLAQRAMSRRLRQRLLSFWNIMAFHRILSQKAERYGVPLIFVDPSNTSRICPVCGRVNPKLRGHVLACSCGLEVGRQEVGALNIARRGDGETLRRFYAAGAGVGGRPCPLTLGRRPEVTTGIRSQLRKSYSLDTISVVASSARSAGPSGRRVGFHRVRCDVPRGQERSVTRSGY